VKKYNCPDCDRTSVTCEGCHRVPQPDPCEGCKGKTCGCCSKNQHYWIYPQYVTPYWSIYPPTYTYPTTITCSTTTTTKTGE
jgi:hypothetical protein